LKILQDAFYLAVEGGECFGIYRWSVAGVAATLLYLPAFGDEMNKARAMTARAARAFAALGFGVLQIDLYGCGDSSGTHADADLDRWTANALHAIDWLRLREPCADPWIWCLRAGALLAAPVLECLPDAPLLLWQPTLSGAQHLNQLLRQKVLGAASAADADRTRMKALRERLRAGEALEVGGYDISPRLADGLERAAFDVPREYRGRIAWFELAPTSPPSLSPAARARAEALRARGVVVAAAALQGPGFWQSTEIEQSDALIEASTAALSEGLARGLPRHAAVL
jgi:exosortase A-associated hydrolase 2